MSKNLKQQLVRPKKRGGNLNTSPRTPGVRKPQSKPVTNLLLLPDGTVQCLYTEEIDLNTLGTILMCNRVSNVEWESGQWVARRKDTGEIIATGGENARSREWALRLEAQYFGRMGYDLFVKGKNS